MQIYENMSTGSKTQRSPSSSVCLLVVSGDSTPVTAADFAIQGLVSKALKQQSLDDMEATVWRVIFSWDRCLKHCRRV